MDKTEKITSQCYKSLLEEANYIKKILLIDIKNRISEARKHGDYSENGELHSELKTKKETEARLVKIEKILSIAEVIDISDIIYYNIVQFGAKVTLKDINMNEIYYQIVGCVETNISENKIYYKSPIAKMLIGKKIESEILINDKKYKITDISYVNIANK